MARTLTVDEAVELINNNNQSSTDDMVLVVFSFFIILIIVAVVAWWLRKDYRKFKDQSKLWIFYLESLVAIFFLFVLLAPLISTIIN